MVECCGERQTDKAHPGRPSLRSAARRCYPFDRRVDTLRLDNIATPVVGSTSTPRRLPSLAVVGGKCGEHVVQVPEGSRRPDAIRKIAWKEAYTGICAIRREGAGETDILRTVEQSESQIQVWRVAGS